MFILIIYINIQFSYLFVSKVFRVGLMKNLVSGEKCGGEIWYLIRRKGC